MEKKSLLIDLTFVGNDGINIEMFPFTLLFSYLECPTSRK